jgi:hypothetical protein
MPSPKIEDFMSKKTPDIKKAGSTVDGSFSCEECNEVVKVALYEEDSRELTWTCSKDHVSKGRL